jgi:hypothetical protein
LWQTRWNLEQEGSPGPVLAEGLQAAGRAIEINNNDANAFAVRGELWKVQAASGNEPGVARTAAEEDCREAWRLNPALLGDYCR